LAVARDLDLQLDESCRVPFLSISTNDRPAIVVKIDEPFARQNFLNADH